MDEVVRGENGEMEIATNRTNPERILQQQQAEERVYEVFAFLSMVSIMHAIEGLSLREIADATGRDFSEVRRAWRQSRSILQEHL